MQLKLAFSNFFNVNVEKILFSKLKLLGLLFAYFIMHGPRGENKIFCTYLLPPKNAYNKCNKTTEAPKTLVAKKNRPCEKFYIIDYCKDARQMSISCLN
jgi:hypothetical protein